MWCSLGRNLLGGCLHLADKIPRRIGRALAQKCTKCSFGGTTITSICSKSVVFADVVGKLIPADLPFCTGTVCMLGMTLPEAQIGRTKKHAKCSDAE